MGLYNYGSCKNVIINIKSPSNPYRDIKRILEKMLQREEVNAMEQLKKEGTIIDNTVETFDARYLLSVEYDGKEVSASITNVETCQVLIEAGPFEFPGLLKAGNVPKTGVPGVHRLEDTDLTLDFDIPFAFLWGALLGYEDSNLPITEYSRLAPEHRTITQRIQDELQFDKGREYFDFNTEPRYHPVSPDLAKFTWDVVLADSGNTNGQGDRFDVTIHYKECNDTPIKGFNPDISLVSESPEGAYFKNANNEKVNQIQVETNDQGASIFSVFIPDAEWDTVTLRAFHEGASPCKPLLDKKIIINNAFTLQFEIASVHPEISAKFQIMDVQLSPAELDDANKVTTWKGSGLLQCLSLKISEVLRNVGIEAAKALAEISVLPLDTPDPNLVHLLNNFKELLSAEAGLKWDDPQLSLTFLMKFISRNGNPTLEVKYDLPGKNGTSSLFSLFLSMCPDVSSTFFKGFQVQEFLPVSGGIAISLASSLPKVSAAAVAYSRKDADMVKSFYRAQSVIAEFGELNKVGSGGGNSTRFAEKEFDAEVPVGNGSTSLKGSVVIDRNIVSIQ